MDPEIKIVSHNSDFSLKIVNWNKMEYGGEKSDIMHVVKVPVLL